MREEFYNGSLVGREIHELHLFFQQWFNGELPPDPSRFTLVMASDFELITPSGILTNRQQIIDMIEQGYSSNINRRIWVEDISTRQLGDLMLATYYELQEDDGTHTKRLATAIFSYAADLPCQASWHHVHETWVE